MLNVMNLSLRHLVFILISVASVSFAQGTDEISKAISTLHEQISFVTAYKTYCDTVAPDLSSANTEALTSWEAANSVAQIKQLVTGFSAISADMAKGFEILGTQFSPEQFAEYFAGKEVESCTNFPQVLADSSLTELYPQEMQLLPTMGDTLDRLASNSTTPTQTSPTPSAQDSNPLTQATPSTQTNPLAQTLASEGTIGSIYFNGTNYFFRGLSQGDQFEFTPEGQEDLTTLTDSISVISYPTITDEEGLASVANNFITHYQSKPNAGILETSISGEKIENPGEHSIAILVVDPGFTMFGVFRLALVDGQGLGILYTHRMYGEDAGPVMREWLDYNAALLQAELGLALDVSKIAASIRE